MTLSTSDVAVCCDSALAQLLGALLNFVEQAHILIAITAWSAKVLTSSICFSVNGRAVDRVTARTRIGKALSPRNCQYCTITSNAQDVGHFVLGVGLAIRNMNCSLFNQNAADAGFATGPD